MMTMTIFGGGGACAPGVPNASAMSTRETHSARMVMSCFAGVLTGDCSEMAVEPWEHFGGHNVGRQLVAGFQHPERLVLGAEQIEQRPQRGLERQAEVVAAVEHQHGHSYAWRVVDRVDVRRSRTIDSACLQH